MRLSKWFPWSMAVLSGVMWFTSCPPFPFWPMAWVAEPSSMKPSAVTLTVTVSCSALPPVHSRKVAMPRPRFLPRASDCARRAAKPFQSARARPWSRICSKAPLSYTCPIGFL